MFTSHLLKIYFCLATNLTIDSINFTSFYDITYVILTV